MTIEKLFKKEKINVRLYNICTKHKFESIDHLKEYYLEYKTFLNLDDCGYKSNEELIELCINYEEISFENEEDNHPKSIVSKLTQDQREAINNFIYVNSKKLTVRSKNRLSLYLKGNFNIENFAEKILFDEYFDAINIQKVGYKSAEEINKFISIVQNKLIEISEYEDKASVLKIKNKLLMKRLFPNINVPDSLLEPVSIFRIVQFLLDKNSLFDTTKTVIVKSGFKIFDEQEYFKIFNKQEYLTLDEIGDKVELTRERIRQLRIECLKEMYDKLAFIQNFDEDLNQKYSIDIDTNYIDIDDATVQKINHENETSFSKEFIMYILYVYFHDKFLLVGNIEDVLQINYSNPSYKHNWKSFYLINRELAQKNDFEVVVNDIHKRINSKIDETYSLDLKSYLSSLLKIKDTDYLSELSSILEHIINAEFELYLDENEELTFKRNTYISIYEYALEALEAIGEPSTIDEIYNKVTEIHPSYDTNEEKLRNAILNEKIFITEAKTNKYGLKKWGGDSVDYSRLSRRDIVEKKLTNSDKPLHISELLDEVHEYKEKTNIRNLITNLKLDTSNTFVFFNQQFVGLTSKKNNYDLDKYENIPLQLGKEIIRKHKQGYCVEKIKIYLKDEYDLSSYESELIINTLDYFNEKNHE